MKCVRIIVRRRVQDDTGQKLKEEDRKRHSVSMRHECHNSDSQEP